MVSILSRTKLQESACSLYFICMLYGVPQGSVSGALVFPMYTFGTVAKLNGIKYHLHANDTQMHISQDPDNKLYISSSLKSLEHCVDDIRQGMPQNLLKVNDNNIL